MIVIMIIMMEEITVRHSHCHSQVTFRNREDGLHDLSVIVRGTDS
jgi:hypothetical protein